MRRKRMQAVACLLVLGLIAAILAFTLNRQAGYAQVRIHTVAIGVSSGTIAVVPAHTPMDMLFIINCAITGTQRIHAIDFRTGTRLYTLTLPSGSPLTSCGNSIAVDEGTGNVFVLTSTMLRGVGPPTDEIRVFSGRTGRAIGSFLPRGSTPVALAVSAHTHRAFVTLADHAGTGTVQVINLQTGGVVRTVPLLMFPQYAIANDDTNRIFILGPGPSGRGLVSILSATDGHVLHTVAISGQPLTMAIDKRRGHAVVISSFSTPAAIGIVSMIDVRTGHLLWSVSIPHEPSALAIDARTGRIFVAVSLGNSVNVLDAKNGSILQIVHVQSNPVALASDEQSGDILVASQGTNNGQGQWSGPGTISVLDSRRDVVTRSLSIGIAPTAIAVDNHDPAIVAVVNAGGMIRTTANWPSDWPMPWLPWLSPRQTHAPESVSILDITH